MGKQNKGRGRGAPSDGAADQPPREEAPTPATGETDQAPTEALPPPAARLSSPPMPSSEGTTPFNSFATPARGPADGALAPPPTPMNSYEPAPTTATTAKPSTPPQASAATSKPKSYGAVDAIKRQDSNHSEGDAVVVMKHRSGETTAVPMGKMHFEGAESVETVEFDDFRLTTQLKVAFTTNWQMKLLLIFVPAAIFGEGSLSSSALFLCSFLGLIPLAAMLGDFTEDLALHSNDVIGALLNVTFGNATELIISIMALRAGMFDVIKLSLIGSVMGNMLLVMGTAFLVGGLRVKTLRFNSEAVNTYGPLLLLSVLGFVIPSAYWSAAKYVLREERSSTVLAVSRHEAVVLCLVYVAYLYFQLVTHKNVFDGEPDSDTDTTAVPIEPAPSKLDEEDETPQFTLAFGIVGLAVASVLISFLSDVLVATLSDAAATWNVPKPFIGIILVPIVGNAAEHATAILMAAKNKMDIAVGVAMGSSIQIALFVMPVLVLIGWAIDAPLNLNFHPFLTVITVMSVLVVNHVVTDGKTNWLEGVMLVAAYVLLALVFWTGSVEMG